MSNAKLVGKFIDVCGVTGEIVDEDETMVVVRLDATKDYPEHTALVRKEPLLQVDREVNIIYDSREAGRVSWEKIWDDVGEPTKEEAAEAWKRFQKIMPNPGRPAQRH